MESRSLSHLFNLKSSGITPIDGSLPKRPSKSIQLIPELVKQLNTRPINEKQPINEVKGIYAGLVMVEKKCIEIVAQQSVLTMRLSDQQLKALVALYRTLLQEHHDFFSTSQHPTVHESNSLKKLATKYAMPARMWRHGIHAFMELLRHRLPDSLEHMLSFIYLPYSIMVLLKGSVPSSVETRIECLARYRVAIEHADPQNREVWSNVAKMWYNEAATKSPTNIGRIQHHLAILARPNIIEQLFYYDKALVGVIPFVNARESIALLFAMFLKDSGGMQTLYLPTESAFVNAYAMLFTQQAPTESQRMLELFAGSLKVHMDRAGVRYKTQGPQMAIALFAGLLDSEQEHPDLWHPYAHQLKRIEAANVSQDGLATNKSVSESVSDVQHVSPRQHEYCDNSYVNTSVNHTIPVSNFRTWSSTTGIHDADPSVPLSIMLTNWTKTYILKLSSNLIRWTNILEANYIRLYVVTWFIACVHANEHEQHSKEAPSEGQSPPSEYSGLVKFLLWLLCGGLIYIVPTTGFDVMSKFKEKFENPISVASITAFTAALAMSASTSHTFPDPWGAICTGVSIGSSLLLWRISRAKKNSTLTMFLRYVIPAVLIWSSLSALTPSEQNGSLDISKSIPCLSIFGSVGMNAFINEKYKELDHFFTWLRDQWSRYPGVGTEGDRVDLEQQAAAR